MVLLEDEDYRDLKFGADKSEQLEKEMLALQILAREKTVQAEAAKVEIERLSLKAQRLEHDNRILMEHYALSRQRQVPARLLRERTPVGQELRCSSTKRKPATRRAAPEPEVTVNAHTRTKRTRGKREDRSIATACGGGHPL